MTDYAVVILSEMARGDGKLCTAAQLAVQTTLPEPTVAKVLKLLAKGGIIVSARGANGGYKLSAAPDTISIGRIVDTLEGPIALTECIEGHADCCALSGSCKVKGKWNPVNAAMKAALENVSLAQMMGGQAA